MLTSTTGPPPDLRETLELLVINMRQRAEAMPLYSNERKEVQWYAGKIKQTLLQCPPPTPPQAGV